MLFLCIFLSERLGLLIEEDERSPSILSERFVLTGRNRYAPDGRPPRTKAWGWLAFSCGVAYYWSILPAIGHFVITLGLAGTFAAPLTCLGGTFDGGYAVGP
jgi:hypothetical protein